MEEVKEETKKKMTYEELENVAHQLSEQNRNLYMKLQEANMSNLFARIDLLFKVINSNAIKSFNKDFVDKCIKEIEDVLTIPEEK